MTFLDTLGVAVPIIQAPMAGTSTPAMAAAASNAGGLGSLGFGGTNAAGAAAMLDALSALTDRPFNVNLFAHRTPVADPAREAGWIAALSPLFAQFGASPPTALAPIYTSFHDDPAMLRLLLERRPRVVSFHFGLPDADKAAALKGAGCVLIASATNLDEARAAKAAGMDAVVAQGFEAGGHRGMFDAHAPDDRFSAMVLTRLLVKQSGLPVIAAGGIMDGAAIRAALDIGAAAAQLGTAFVACDESAADAGYRAALASEAARHTVMTAAISGRPARCLANRFTAWGQGDVPVMPDYPMVYDAGKALNAAAKAAGETGFGAQWAGQGAPLSRPMSTAALFKLLREEAGL